MNTLPVLSRTTLLVLALAGAIAAAPNAGAALHVDLSSTPIHDGQFRHAVTITNAGTEDVALVSLIDAPLDDPAIGSSFETPPGFEAAYDAGFGLLNGIIDFFPALGSSDTFAAGSSLGGFVFLSSSAPPEAFTEFEALTVLGEILRGTVRFADQPAVSDQGASLLLVGIGLAGLAVASRNRENHSN